MPATFGADILETLIRVSVKEQSAALYAVPPVPLVVRILSNIVRQEKVESGRYMPATFGADILETLIRVSVEEQSTALYAVPPARLIVPVLSYLMREHEIETFRPMTTVP